MNKAINHCNFNNKLFILRMIIFLYKKAFFVY
jgi:hypothetical protein